MLLAKYGESFTFHSPIIKAGEVNHAGSGDWTPAAGDVKVSKDEGTQANVGTLPTFSNGEWKWTLSATEMQAAKVYLKTVDSATKAVEDQAFIITTFGHASAHIKADLNEVGAGQRLAVDVEAVSGDTTAADNLESACDNYSATRGLAGTALPNAAADAAGGLPISEAGGLDMDARLSKLAISGSLVADADDLANITNNTRAALVCPKVMRLPDSSSVTYKIRIGLFDTEGNAEAPDSAPTIAAVDESGNSRDSNLDSTTMTLLSVGRYEAVYTVASTHDKEQLVFSISVTEGSATRIYDATTIVADDVDVGFTASDRLILGNIEADTNELQTDDVPGLIAALNDISAADILTTALTESYAADGSAPTLTQAVLLALQHLSESSISGTTKTVKRLDGSTTAATFTLDDASTPTSITRAT